MHACSAERDVAIAHGIKVRDGLEGEIRCANQARIFNKVSTFLVRAESQKCSRSTTIVIRAMVHYLVFYVSLTSSV